jgi:hypothetical protein
MKKYIEILILIALFFFPVISQAQSSHQDVFEKYANEPGCSSVTMEKKMIKAIASKSEDQDLVNLLDGIQSIKILSSNGKNENMISDVKRYVSIDNMTKMGERAENGKTDSFYIRDGGKYQSIFIMLSVSPAKTTVIRIFGFFDVKDVSKLSRIAR